MELARFGHHPHPGTDFCVEVERLQNEVWNLEHGIPETPDAATLRRDVDRAMAFRVGGDECAVAAKQSLREMEASMRANV